MFMPVPFAIVTVWSGAVFTTVNVPAPVIGEVPPTEMPVPDTKPTLVTVPPPPVAVLVTVYVGKLPDTLMPVPAVRLPVAVTVTTPLDVIGDPETFIPVPAATPTLVTVPPEDGDEFVTVYVGKVPVTFIPLPALKEPVPETVKVG